MKKFLFMALVAYSSFASAANWQLAAVSQGDNKMYLDESSIVSVGPYKKAWVMTVFAMSTETDTYPKKQFRSSKSLQYFHCKERTNATVQMTRYAGENGGGDTVDSRSVKFNAQMLEEVVPDTIGEGLLEAVCGSAALRAARHKILSGQ